MTVTVGSKAGYCYGVRRAIEAALEESKTTGALFSAGPIIVNDFLASHKTSPLALRGASLLELLRRPELDYNALSAIDPDRPDIPADVAEQVEIAVKYEGYIRRQERDIADMQRMESRSLPEGLDYLSMSLLRTEARQKLDRIRPRTLGQAGRISGVSPADVAALMVILSQMEEKHEL